MVKRYVVVDAEEDQIQEDDYGGFVKWTDHAELEKELTRLSMAMGNPCLHWDARKQNMYGALVDEAIRRLQASESSEHE